MEWAKIRRLDEPFEADGQWRVEPGETALFGRLSYTPEAGLSLILTGPNLGFGRCLDVGWGPQVFSGFVTGDALGRSVTLVGCSRRETQNHGPLATERFRVERAFFGDGGPYAGDTMVIGIRLGISRLDDWASPAFGFFHFGEDTEEFTRYDVEFRPAKYDLVASSESETVSLHFTSWWSNRKTTLQFKARSEFVVDIHGSVTIDEALARYGRAFQNLLTLASGEICHPLWLHFVVGDGEATRTIELVQRPDGFGARAAWPLVSRGLFSLVDLKDSFAERINAWLRLSSTYHTVLDLTFATIRDAGEHVEASYLALVQAIEGYHRQSTASKSMPLRLRIAEVVSLAGELLDDVTPAEERDTFIKKCVRARNALAHHVEDPEVTNKEVLYQLIRVLLRLLAVVFLMEMGFDRSSIAEHLRSGPSARDDSH